MFMEREAPVSKSKGMIDIDCGFVGLINGDEIDLVQKAVVTVTSLCPCSKEISDYGAHNQRGAVTVEVRTLKDENGTPVTLPMGDLIFAAEESASCRIYPVLKRPDERWITMEGPTRTRCSWRTWSVASPSGSRPTSASPPSGSTPGTSRVSTATTPLRRRPGAAEGAPVGGGRNRVASEAR